MQKTYEPIVVEQLFEATYKEVWIAITDIDVMRKWYFSNISSFSPKVGFETKFVVQVEDRVFPHQWKVTEVQPQKKITYEWTFEGYSGRGVSQFDLFESGKKTRLRLTFTVLENFPDTIPEFKRESGLEGWNYFIKESLKRYLESEN